MDNGLPNGVAKVTPIDDILADYMDRVDEGEQVDHEEFIAAHPEAAEELRAYFEDAAALGEMMADASDGDTDALAKHDAATEVGPIRRIGDYELQEEIGRGGMGVVYRAFHTRLKKVVALKVLPPERMSDSHAVARFEREMEATGKLEHPNVARATDAGEHEGSHYLAMEYVDGVDLATLVEPHKRLPVADACELIRQAAVGLQAAHEHGLVHRDIKPSNLILSRGGHVKVLDMGLARLHADEALNNELTGTGQILGTADYMAPEQASDVHLVDIRADIYSLGCSLYRLLAGRGPFGGPEYPTPLAKVTGHGRDPVPPIRELRPDVPDELAAVLNRMLAKEPEDRFATPGEVAEALAAFTDGSGLPELVARFRETHQPDHSGAKTNEYLSSPATETSPDHEAKPARVRRRWPLVVAVGLAGVLLLGAILEFTTRDGTVRIEIAEGVDTKNLQVVFTPKGGGEVTVADEKAGWEIRLENGTYAIEARGTQDHLDFNKDSVVVSRRGFEIVKVSRRTSNPLPYEQIDLIDLIDAKRDAIYGEWRSQDNSLVTPTVRGARLQIPCVPPSEYDIEIHATRQLPGSSLDIGLIGNGRRFAVGLDGFYGRLSGISCVDGHPVEDSRNETTRLGPVFRTGQRSRIICEVRNRRVRAIVDGRVIVDWSGSLERLSAPAWAITPNEDCLFIGSCLAEYRIHKMVLRPISGAAELVNVPKRTPEADAAVFPPCTARLRATLTAHTDRVLSVSISPDGKTLASAGTDRIVRLWDLPSCRERKALVGHTDEVVSTAFSPDGTTLASAGSDRVIRLWNLETGEQRASLSGHTDQVTSVVFSPGGETLVSASNDLTIILWNTKTGERLRTLRGHAKGLRCLAFSSNGKTFASGGWDGVIHVWRAKTGDRLQTLKAHVGIVRSLVFSPDGETLVSAGADRTIRFWDAETGAHLQQVFPAHDECVRCLAFTSDGNTLVSGSFDQTVNLWNTSNARKCQTLTGHMAPVISVAISPDGKVLASASFDHTVKLWDLRVPPPPAVAPFDATTAKKHQQTWAEHLGVPVERNVDLGDGVSIPFVLIPPGEFLMGAPDSNSMAGRDEKPQHRVRLTRPFYVGKYEVTTGQFAGFVQATGYVTDREKPRANRQRRPAGYDRDSHEITLSADHVWKDSAPATDPTHPVLFVSWDDAQAFCEWATKTENCKVRLPTEAEWEFTCRAGTTTQYWAGDSSECLIEIANLGRQRTATLLNWKGEGLGDDGYGFTAPVGSFEPNPFGLYDILGNACEWCSDWYGSDYYRASVVDGPAGPESGSAKVYRGAGWDWACHDDAARAAIRSARRGHSPGTSSWAASLGFRVVMEIPLSPSTGTPGGISGMQGDLPNPAINAATHPGEMHETLRMDTRTTEVLERCSLDWVTVGDPHNPPGPPHPGSGAQAGSVGYVFRIGKYEVTNAQYAAFLNAKAASREGADVLGLYDAKMGNDPHGGITRNGNGTPADPYRYGPRASMADKPVNFVDFHDAIRFVNWLHNGQGDGDTEDGAYTITQEAVSDNTVRRNPNARVFLPNSDEWNKAAYYEPGASEDGYWAYATRSDTAPTPAEADPEGNIRNPGRNVANYRSGARWFNLPAHVTTVGSAGTQSESYYGAADMTGNVWEWTETVPSPKERQILGGHFADPEERVLWHCTVNADPSKEQPSIGFRVASLLPPEAQESLGVEAKND